MKLAFTPDDEFWSGDGWGLEDYEEGLVSVFGYLRVDW